LVYDVGPSGDVLVRHPLSGAVRSTTNGPGDLRPTCEIGVVGVDRSGRLGVLSIADLATGETSQAAESVIDATFAGLHVLVRRGDGMLEVRDGDSLGVLAEYPANAAVTDRPRPVGNGNLLAGVMVENRVSLTDVLSGVEIGSIPMGPAQERRMAAVAFSRTTSWPRRRGQ
jgi:hypothetical protein